LANSDSINKKHNISFYIWSVNTDYSILNRREKSNLRFILYTLVNQYLNVSIMTQSQLHASLALIVY
jgi:hypothetical protein